MSKQWALLLWDDLDAAKDIRTEADKTLIFSVGGKDYELDLTSEHYGQFMKFVQPYIDAASHAGAPVVDKHGKIKGGTRAENAQFLKELRRWADSQGRTREYEGKKNPKLYSYPAQLRKDYEAHLAALAGRAA